MNKVLFFIACMVCGSVNADSVTEPVVSPTGWSSQNKPQHSVAITRAMKSAATECNGGFNINEQYVSKAGEDWFFVLDYTCRPDDAPPSL